MPTPSKAVDLNAVLATFDEPWQPRTVAVFNDYDLRVVKMDGPFSRHRHPETDEVFLVLKGSLTIHHDDEDVRLTAGQAYVVPRGTAHQPIASPGTEVLLIEPSSTVNTGDTPSEFTTGRQVITESG